MKILKPGSRSIKTIFVATFASLILITGAQSVYADLQITSPKSGDNWIQNSAQTITWTYEGVPNTATVRLLLIQGANWENEPLRIIATPMPVTTGSYSSVVRHYHGGVANPGSDYRIWIEEYRLPGHAESDIFTISPPIHKVPSQALNQSKVLLPLRPLPAGFVIDGPPDFQEYIKGGLRVLGQNEKWWNYVMEVVKSFRLVKRGEFGESTYISEGVVSMPVSRYESIRKGWGTKLDQMYYALAQLMIHEASHPHGANEDQAHAISRKGICEIIRDTRPELINFFECNNP